MDPVTYISFSTLFCLRRRRLHRLVSQRLRLPHSAEPLGVSPGSHCAACGAPIPWYNNLPIISWLVLRGRAACCGTRIDLRYWLVEVGMAFLFLAIWLQYGQTDPMAAVIYAIMISGLTAACLIDLDHYIIPDRFSLGGCVAGFIACAIHPCADGPEDAAAGLFLEPGQRHRRRADAPRRGVARHAALQEGSDGHGRREVARRASARSSARPRSSGFFPLSSLIGSVLGVALIFWQRGAWGTRIPYGPFLGLAAILWLFGGADFMHGYWHNVGSCLDSCRPRR